MQKTMIDETEYLIYLSLRGLKNTGDWTSRFKPVYAHFQTVPFNFEGGLQLIAYLREQGKAPQTINNAIKVIRHIADYYSIKGIDYDKSIDRIRYLPKEIRTDKDILTPQEVKRIADCKLTFTQGGKTVLGKKSWQLNTRYTVMVYLLAMGMRIGEVCNLRWADISQDVLYIRSNDTWNPKTMQSTRTLPVPDKLKTLLAKLKNSSEYVLGTGRGKLNQAQANEIIKRKCEKLKIKKTITSHTFRHSLITSEIAKGTPIAWVAKTVGHADWNTTKQYSHLSTKEVEKVINNSNIFSRCNNPNVKEKIVQSLANIHDERILLYIDMIIQKETLR
jgi:integrase